MHGHHFTRTVLIAWLTSRISIWAFKPFLSPLMSLSPATHFIIPSAATTTNTHLHPSPANGKIDLFSLNLCDLLGDWFLAILLCAENELNAIPNVRSNWNVPEGPRWGRQCPDFSVACWKRTWMFCHLATNRCTNLITRAWFPLLCFFSYGWQCKRVTDGFWNHDCFVAQLAHLQLRAHRVSDPLFTL